MTFTLEELLKQERPFWFCLQAQPKHEHLAAEALRRQFNLEVYAPRIRFRKNTRRGAVWFVEPLFPGYLFAHFSYPQMHRQVRYAPGVRSIVQFGPHVATLADHSLAALRAANREQELIVIDPELQVGQPVQITEGAFRGLEALVTQLIPAKERVKVLLDFLGRSLEAELGVPQVLSMTPPRLEV